MTLPLGCSFCWFACSDLALSAPSVCFFVTSALIFTVDVLPSTDSAATRWKLTNAIFAPAGNGAGGARRRGRGLRGGGRRGVSGRGLAGRRSRPGGLRERGSGAQRETSASDAAMTKRLITINPFK